MRDQINSWALLIAACALLQACTVPAMKLDGDLGNTPALDVQGKQGWQVGQVLTFGPYRTGPVKRSWTKGYDYPFIIRFTKAREKLSFETVDGGGNQAQVFCAGKLSEQDFHGLEQYFDVNLRTQDVFGGTIAIDGTEPYDFFVDDLNQNRTSGQAEGKVQGKGLEVSIRPVWHLATGQKSWDTRPLGFEFVIGGSVAGAVETVNEGRVWLDGSLVADHKLVLASLASALLLRSDLADHND